MSSTDHPQPQHTGPLYWRGLLLRDRQPLTTPQQSPDTTLDAFVLNAPVWARIAASVSESPETRLKTEALRPAHDPMDFLAGATVMAAVCGLLALALPAAYAAGAALLALVLLALFCRRERDRTLALRADQRERGR